MNSPKYVAQRDRADGAWLALRCRVNRTSGFLQPQNRRL